MRAPATTPPTTSPNVSPINTPHSPPIARAAVGLAVRASVLHKAVLLALPMMVAIGLASVSFAQTQPAAPLAGPAAAEPVTTLAPEGAAMTEPFVGVVTADKVYVRSGPGTVWYELGHVSKGDTVQVVGSKGGWYEIFPPNGTFCLIAKDLVQADADGKSGTVKGDYVNLRAGTSMYKQDGYTKDSAVLCVVRKGQKLTILGSTDKYYEVAPTDRAFVFINPQYVKAGAGTEYKIPDLKPGGGITGAIGNTVTQVAALPAAGTGTPSPTTPLTSSTLTPQTPLSETPASPTTAPGTPGEETARTPASQPALPPIEPSTTFSQDAYGKFNELDRKYQAELLKPVGTRDLDGLTKEYKELGDAKDSPPSVKQGSEARIAAIEKLMTIQRLQKENVSSEDALAAQRKALHEQYSTAEKAIEAYENSGPYLAKGTLQTSVAVTGKYALVDPATRRTVAYIDPNSDIDIGSLLGKYIGVRGSTQTAAGTEVTVIKVKNATLLPAPGKN